MISLHIAKWLDDEGYGTLDTDIFWEEAALDSNGKPKDGIWVVTRGAPLSRFNTTTQQFDIYSRYANKITGSQKLEEILEKIKESYGDTCVLPTVPPYSVTVYENVRLRPVSGIENVGSDEQDKIVRVISAEVQYNIGEDQ
jgi:hypothetical protein